MSNLVNKVKEAVTGHPQGTDTVGGTTHAHGTHAHGTHGTHTHGTTGTTGTTGMTGGAGTGMGSTTAGPHDSNLANKMDPRVDSDLDGSRAVGGGAGTMGTSTGTAGYGTGSTTGAGYGTTAGAGPHSSSMANKMDPRVDSTTGYSSSGMGTTGTTGSTNAGPHSSNIANKLDPRVDSDLGGRGSQAYGANTATGGTSMTGTTGMGTQGYGAHSTGAPYGAPGTATGHTNTSTGAGPHDSSLLNKMDPRVDSDTGYSTGGAGMTGTTGTTGHTGHHHGTHDTHHHAGTHHAGTHHAGTHHNTTGHTGAGLADSTGPAPNTAGPHKSDMLNKLDPRVDSDLDGSKTIGGDKTFSGSGSAV